LVLYGASAIVLDLFADTLAVLQRLHTSWLPFSWSDWECPNLRSRGRVQRPAHLFPCKEAPSEDQQPINRGRPPTCLNNTYFVHICAIADKHDIPHPRTLVRKIYNPSTVIVDHAGFIDKIRVVKESTSERTGKGSRLWTLVLADMPPWLASARIASLEELQSLALKSNLSLACCAGRSSVKELPVED
jgi:hypothetical protein